MRGLRRTLLVVAAVLTLTTPARAYLPANIEGVLKSWFDGAGRFKCIKVSGGGTANCLFGANISLSNGCAVSGGVMTCSGGFDAPAQPTTGTYFVWKEGSNNGTSTVTVQAPPNLSTSRTNTYNTDGTYKASDVATGVTNEYGLVARFNTANGTLGVVGGVSVAGLPHGAFEIGPGAGLTTAIAANTVQCLRFVARDTIVNATKLSFDVGVNLAATNGSVCLYSDSDAASGTILAPLVSGAVPAAKSVASTGEQTYTGLDNFSLYAGTRYRLCWTSNNGTTTVRYMSGGGQVDSTLNDITTIGGTAAQASSSGACPTGTGALTGASVYPALAVVGQ